MTKKIFPGNWVTNLSSYQGQPVVAVPGRVYCHKVGYALVDSTGGTSFDVIIPSPDKRQDDKVRADITGLTVPAGAVVYSLGIRVADTRKEKDKGDATSGLVGTNTDTLKLASAVNTTAGGVISASALGTTAADLTVASTTIAPGSGRFSSGGATLSGALTLKVFVADSTGASAGSTLTSSVTGGSPIIAEVSYYMDDDVADVEDTFLPYLTES
ncbi:MAG: hypothetical protein CMJ39_00070 [Phycisphaerae bacterium]|nr:hypothetical protein [Phycisphaerae bacterium]|tara:strand:- start:1321 stop:1962 length:642 start_codon:yes stop_codon:yes gene_type:complete